MIAWVLVVFLVALAFAGCTESKQAETDTATADVATQAPAEQTETSEEAEAPAEVDYSQFKVGFAQDTLNQPWRNYQAECVESAFAAMASPAR
jgi:type IV pilus biogenesis protein CpaD/CtpE